MALSPRSQQIFRIIGEHFDQHGIPPTIRDIQEAGQISSTSVVAHHLKALARDGQINWTPGKSRSIEIVGRWESATARSAALIADRIFASAELSREVVGYEVVSGEALNQLRRWRERLGA